MTGIPESGRALHTLRHTCLGAMIAFALAGTAWAQSGTDVRAYDVPAGELAQAVNRIGQLSGVQVIYDIELLRGKRIGALSGQLTLAQALDRALAGSGLTYELVNGNTVVIRQAGAQAPAKPQAATRNAPASARADEPEIQELGAMTVTGTRIRGGTTPSPVIGISAAQIQEEGFTDLGEVIRSVPQNFSGGQNPGVINGGAGSIANQNITGGSALNLRGLGPDATLTLLNGRRLSYGGFTQIVDISAIPVEAVERLEIVPDGASAIYGSDAVGGVGNVILKREFDGVTIGALYGTATDGGLNTREYSATAGTTWASGGLIAAYKHTSTDQVYADQRGYTENVYHPQSIYPSNELRSGLLSVHQSLGDIVVLRLDALRTEREMDYYYGYSGFYYLAAPETTASLVSPSVEFSLPNDWTLTVGGAWGKDETDYYGSVVRTTGVTLSGTFYGNRSRAYEVGAEGPLFTLSGGDARLAVGAGYRTNEFLQRNLISGATSTDGDDSSRFAYAEINLPLIGSDQNIAGVRRLALTGAVRGEDYDSFGGVTTPKFGVIYGPSADFTLKASWGKSFKAPTLSQRYQAQSAYLYPVTSLGGTGYAIDATALALSGGDLDLRPERARTWSASLAFHPEALPGLEAELTWFDIDYTSRVVQPLSGVFSQALSNPIYADFVSYYPTAAEQADLLANSAAFYNYVSAGYDPSKVIAIADARYANTAQQRVKGLDLSGSYRFDLDSGRLTVRGSTSWLDSTQQLTSAQSPYDLAGMLFHPAKVNGRVGAVWNQDGFSVSTFANYTSGVTNSLDGAKSASFTTFDATLRYDTGERNDAWSGLALELSAQNLFDRAPPLYAPTSATDFRYDSTNYSAVGRFVSVSISKHF